MGVWLRNFQSRIAFNESLLRLHCSFLLHAIRAGRFDVSIVCVNDRRIQHYNHTYRGIDAPTDVLSFPYHEDLKAGILPQPVLPHDYNLGDIILGMPVIADHCRQEPGGGTKLSSRLPILVTHGLCHLLGYRHNTSSSTKQMYDRERSVLSVFNNTFGTDLRPLTEVDNV